jgi:hypothetical protein
MPRRAAVPRAPARGTLHAWRARRTLENSCSSSVSIIESAGAHAPDPLQAETEPASGRPRARRCCSAAHKWSQCNESSGASAHSKSPDGTGRLGRAITLVGPAVRPWRAAPASLHGSRPSCGAWLHRSVSRATYAALIFDPGRRATSARSHEAELVHEQQAPPRISHAGDRASGSTRVVHRSVPRAANQPDLAHPAFEQAGARSSYDNISGATARHPDLAHPAFEGAGARSSCDDARRATTHHPVLASRHPYEPREPVVRRSASRATARHPNLGSRHSYARARARRVPQRVTKRTYAT